MVAGASLATVNIMDKQIRYIRFESMKPQTTQIKSEPCPQFISYAVHVQKYNKNIN